MLLRHSLIYLLARGIPGLINFLAIVIYTRLLEPTEYGRYAVVLASVGLVNVFLFQWLRLGVTRFLQYYSNKEKKEAFLSSISICFAVVVMITGFLTGISTLIFPDHKGFWILGMFLLWAQAWFELNLELLRSQLSPTIYGLVSLSKALLALCLGTVFVLLGLGAIGLLLGLILGFVTSSLFIAKSLWKSVQLSLLDTRIIRQLLSYGLPLTATFAMSFIINSSDRLLLSWLSGADETGQYSVIYDLSQQTLILLMTIVNLAAYPLVVRALEHVGPEAARKQLKENAVILFSVGLPATMGLILLTPNITNVILGASYRESAYVIMPLIVIAAFIQGTKSFYLDLAFHLGKKTILQAWTVFIAALVNIILNLWWIPKWGSEGAAYATICAFFIAAVASGILGRHSFPFS